MTNTICQWQKLLVEDYDKFILRIGVAVAQIVVKNCDKYLAQALQWRKYLFPIFTDSVALARDDTFF